MAVPVSNVQSWLKNASQEYLENTESCHILGAINPDVENLDGRLHASALRTTTQNILGARCALIASTGLITCSPDDDSKYFFSTQVQDEARHLEIYTQHMYDLGVKKGELDDTVRGFGHPGFLKFGEILLEEIDKKNFLTGVVGQNVMLDGMQFTLFEMLLAINNNQNKKLAQVLAGIIAAKRRHIIFGVKKIISILDARHERRSEVKKMHEYMYPLMIESFTNFFGDCTCGSAPAKSPSDVAMWRGVDLLELSAGEKDVMLCSSIIGDYRRIFHFFRL